MADFRPICGKIGEPGRFGLVFLYICLTMRKNTGLIIIGAGALAMIGYYFTGLKKTINKLSVSVFGVKYNGERTQNSIFLKIWFDLKLKVNNPTNRKINISETNLNFYVNGVKAGEVRNNQQLTINPNVYSYVIIPTYLQTLTMFNLVSQFLDTLKKKEPIKVNVKGSMNIEGNIINIDENFNLDLPGIANPIVNLFNR